jgi:2-polyprenyl-6-methoxyphenol hydroxylase-like FAD-dependent oxidoreductase
MPSMPRKVDANALHVAIVGGSMGGLTTALLLRTLGHDVDVFERATGVLTGFGAGIVAHEVSVRYFVERTRTSLDNMTVPVRTYRLLDGTGSLLWEEPVAYRFVSWGSLYRALLSEFSRERYLQGAALVGFSQDGHGVYLRFASGQQLRYDLLVLADGVLSTGRQLLFPGVEPVYAGYVAWRGTVGERDIPVRVLERIDDTITYALIPNSHILVYPIPGADGRVDRVHRRWNFVWYRNVDKSATFDADDRSRRLPAFDLAASRSCSGPVRARTQGACRHCVAARDRLYRHSHRTSVHPGDYGCRVAHYGHRSGLPLGGRRVCGPTARGSRHCQGRRECMDPR